MALGRSRRRKRKWVSDCAIYFTTRPNEQGQRQSCVFAECGYSGRFAGPVWGHKDESVRRALATLTEECECPARFHRGRFYEGHRRV